MTQFLRWIIFPGNLWIEKFFYPANYLGTVVWVGVAGSIIMYTPGNQLWTLRVPLTPVWATSNADVLGLLLGNVSPQHPVV